MRDVLGSDTMSCPGMEEEEINVAAAWTRRRKGGRYVTRDFILDYSFSIGVLPEVSGCGLV